MNDPLKAELVTWLKELRESTTGARAFLIEKAPLYIQEVIAWGKIEAWLWIVGSILVFLFSLLLIFIGFRVEDRDSPPFFVFGLVAFACSVILFSVSIYSLLYVTFAPNLYVVQHLKALTG